MFNRPCRAARQVATIAPAFLSVLAAPASAAEDSLPDRDEILVTGRQEGPVLRDLDTPSFGIALDEAQIAAINAVNAEDVLRYAPSLIVRKRYAGDANATLSFRNMHTQQTPRALVTVDGFTISNFLGADFVTAPKWGVLAPSDIAGAEIVYGPASARYSGNSMGGTLRLRTREITETAIRAEVQGFGQTYRYYRTDEDLVGYSVDAGLDYALRGGGGLSIGYRHFENEGQPQEWRTVSAGSPYASQGTVDPELTFLRIGAQDSTVRAVEEQFRLRGYYPLGNGWTMRGLAALMQDGDDTLHPRSFLVDEQGRETFVGIEGVTQGKARSTDLLAGLGLSGEAAGWALDLSVSRYELLDHEERRSDPFDSLTGKAPLSGYVTGNDAWWNSVEASAERRFGSHGLAFGLSYAGYRDGSATFDAPDWAAGAATQLRAASGGRTSLSGIFGEDAIAVTPAITATLGLRYERWRASRGFLSDAATTVRYAARSDDALSPKAAIRFRPDGATELTASAALATRFPTVQELYQAGLIGFGPNVGQLDLNGFDPDLRPERGVDLQLTASRQIGRVRMTVSLYRQDVKDTIFTQTIAIPDPETGELAQSSLATNIGKVRTNGADLVVAAQDVLVAGLAIDANASWTDATITRNALNPDLVGNRFPRVPQWRLNASVRYSPDKNWQFAAGFRHQSTPDRNLENNATSLCDTFYCVSSFSFVDLKATRRIGAFDLSLGVDNLLDEKAFVYHPYPGRSFLIQLGWKGALL